MEKIIKAQRAAQGKPPKAKCPPVSGGTQPEPSGTSTGTPAADELADANNEQEMVVNTRIVDTEFYEIKMVVGWAPPKGHFPGEKADVIKEGIKNNATPLFLTLIDHTFDIAQDGTFSLTLTYRARIEGLLSDGKANVLATPSSRHSREKLNDELAQAKQICDNEAIEEIRKRLTYQSRITKAWLGDALLANLMNGTKDHLGRTQVYTAVIEHDDLSDAQWHTEDIPLTSLNTNIIGPGKGKGFDKFGNNAGAATTGEVLANLYKDNLKYFLALEEIRGASGERMAGGMFAAGASVRDSTKTDEERRQNYENLENANADGHLNVMTEEQVSTLDINSSWFAGFYRVGAALVGALDDVNYAAANITWAQTPDETNDAIGKGDDYYPIHFMFLGDLIENAAKHALSWEGSRPNYSNVSFAPCTTEKIKVLLGPVSLKDKQGNFYNINVADIPISLRGFQSWFQRNVTDSDRESYSLLKFIRDLIQEAVIDVMKAECFQGNLEQKITFKTGVISIPLKAGSKKSPIEEKISDAGLPSKATVQLSTKVSGVPQWTQDKTALANLLPLSIVHPGDPLYQMNVWEKSTNMFHYLYVYGENAEPAIDLRGVFAEDADKGIYHLYMGAEKGLVKNIKFAKTDQPFLREARFEKDALNPLAELSAVYKADVTMVGNTMFHPGQYVFINMQPVGQDLGHPGVVGTPSNQLGLGGYHIITKVSNDITEGNDFETTLNCLWDNSGDGRSRLSAGSQTTVDTCPEDKTSAADATVPGAEGEAGGGASIEDP